MFCFDFFHCVIDTAWYKSNNSLWKVFERSGPGFDSRRPWSYFSFTHQNRRIISSTPAATSTAGNYYYHGQHIPPLHWWPRRDARSGDIVLPGVHVTCILTVSILRDKTITWFYLPCKSCAATISLKLPVFFYHLSKVITQTVTKRRLNTLNGTKSMRKFQFPSISK